MLHRLFSVNGTAARCNDAFIGFQSRIDLILNRKKAFISLICNNLAQKTFLPMLNHKIRINKLIPQSLCKDNANAAFAGSRHSY